MTSVRCMAADSRTGRRPQNEDAFCARPDSGLFVVSDGLGGYANGDLASRMTVDIIESFFESRRIDYDVEWPFGVEPGRSLTENKVSLSVRLAHRAIRRRYEGSEDRMAATVAVMAADEDQLVVGHMGDSRVYRLRGDELEQLTRDHSMYNEFLDAGVDLPPYREYSKRHVITRVLGIDTGRGEEPDMRVEHPEPGDIYLMCTDGLSDVLDEERIRDILRDSTVDAAAERLVNEAYVRGSGDNITAVVVEFDR